METDDVPRCEVVCACGKLQKIPFADLKTFKFKCSDCHVLCALTPNVRNEVQQHFLSQRTAGLTSQ